MVGYADVRVCEEIAFPSIQSMRSGANVEENHLWESIDQPITSDHLMSDIDERVRLRRSTYVYTVASHFVDRLSDGFDFAFAYFDFCLHERIVVRAQADVIIAVLLLRYRHFRADDRIDTAH